MSYNVIIPARLNSKRLPGKNMRILGDKPLIQHSIDFALENFEKKSIWVNSDDESVLNLACNLGVNGYSRPLVLGGDEISTVEVIINQLEFFKENNIFCDSIILLQPTNPFRDNKLINHAIKMYESSGRNSLATFSLAKKKYGLIENLNYVPLNYIPGQRSQDLNPYYYENGSLYITNCASILNGKIITNDVFPLICDDIRSSIDIDYLEDFLFAELILKKQIL
jgi:CMP-N-acetylneuraminic acid synthetase